jgi:hypothetical protein
MARCVLHRNRTSQHRQSSLSIEECRFAAAVDDDRRLWAGRVDLIIAFEEGGRTKPLRGIGA